VIGSESATESNESVRISETAWIPKTDPIIQGIYKRAQDKIGLLYENAEDLQVVRYSPGEFYKSHQDAFCDDASIQHMGHTGQRKRTLIIYLNEGYDGGGTEFPNLSKVYKGRQRDALCFHTLDTEGKCCQEAEHAGQQVISGQKLICNIWFH
jgi:prolyl 4-hydroxylase